MRGFDESNWAKADFSREYRDNADIYIVERKRLLEILTSFYRRFLKKGSAVLDLGCGDGIITRALLEVDASLSATLADGSSAMLDTARERLRTFSGVRYARASFQELTESDILQNDFDFVVSSLAIHHLTMEEKSALFRRIYSWLKHGGHFLNIDVVLAPAAPLEEWYLLLWKEWIGERKKRLGIEGDYFDDIAQRYKDNRDNKPDTLDEQMYSLKKIGFREVDCYYKYGIFAMYGGSK